MRTDLLDYELPDELVARHPPAERDGARLLVLPPAGPCEHRWVRELPELVPGGALVVLNETRVLRARLLGLRRPGGGHVEILLLRRVSPEGEQESWLALGRANKPLRAGTVVDAGGIEIAVQGLAPGEVGGVLLVRLTARGGVATAVERDGHVPLPPYLGRDDEPLDGERYQTTFARVPGSVAAPTAGLHLTSAALARLAARGVDVARVTLHVGAGTFRPVTADDLDCHVMHAEECEVPAEAVAAVARARARGAPVIAIGTTVVRALESAADPGRPGHLLPVRAETRLLIQPGHRFAVVDALLTNFHQPRSTLLALVAAFAGLDRVRAAYREAVSLRYRFLSYGDALWLPGRAPPT